MKRNIFVAFFVFGLVFSVQAQTDKLIVNTDGDVSIPGNVGIGSDSPQARLDLSGDGDVILIPRKTTSGNPADGFDGMLYYNDFSNQFRIHMGGRWKIMAVQNTWEPCANQTCVIQPRTNTGDLFKNKVTTYNLPNVPDHAAEVLVYMWIAKGRIYGYEIDEDVHYQIYTQEGTTKYIQKLAIRDYDNYSWVTNSDNMWFPVTSDKKLYVYPGHSFLRPANDFPPPNGRYLAGIDILGYRVEE